MSNEADLVLDFYTEQERYTLTYDQNNNPIPVEVNFTAVLTQGGESLGPDEHTKTLGEPVTDALVVIQVKAPDGQVSEGLLTNNNDGTYTLTLSTPLTGNYEVVVIASNFDETNQNYNNSQYVITTEHSFFISPYD